MRKSNKWVYAGKGQKWINIFKRSICVFHKELILVEQKWELEGNQEATIRFKAMHTNFED